MNEHLQAVQDRAWDIKEICDELSTRKLSAGDVASLQSIHRDMGRLEVKLIAIRDKRKRSTEELPDAPLVNGAGQMVMGGDNAE